jgi:uncharacterized protein (DUF952 family)
MPEPTFLYKILDAPPPSPLLETLPTTGLDAKDGFIHLSLAGQIPVTADLFFADYSKLWLLKLRRSDLDGTVKYSTEPNGGVPEGCAHVHDSKKGLGSGNVEEVIEVDKDGAEEWKKVPKLLRLKN